MDTEEIRWVKTTANELNNLLQVISESSQFLEISPRRQRREREAISTILRNGIERAGKATRMMVERVGGFNAVSGGRQPLAGSMPQLRRQRCRKNPTAPDGRT